MSIDMISGQILDGKNIKQAANLLQQGDVIIPKYVNVKDCALVFYEKVITTSTMFVYLRRTATEYLNAGYIIIISEATLVSNGVSIMVSSVNITNSVGSAIYILDESSPSSEKTLLTNKSDSYSFNDGALLISLTSMT